MLSLFLPEGGYIQTYNPDADRNTSVADTNLRHIILPSQVLASNHATEPNMSSVVIE